jgi:hypothetical protein
MGPEKAVQRVYGARGVANDIEVKLSSTRTDPEIARDARTKNKERLLLFFPSLQVETCHIRHSWKQSQPFKESIGNSQGTDRNASLCSGATFNSSEHSQ